MKKKAIAFTIADQNNLKYARMLENSLRKFHSADELPLIIYTPPQHEITRDPMLFYRATPYYAKDLIKDYDLVLKLDADQIITGSLSDILSDDSYDAGVVYNWNRSDVQKFQPVALWNIPPQLYFNCGLVAMRSERFVKHWFKLCNSGHFNNYPYREQDLLNILAYYGDYTVRCFDDPNQFTGKQSWYGLRAKGSWLDIQMKGDEMIIPRNDLNDPDKETTVKVIHWAGGKDAPKMNYRTQFIEEVIKRLDYLVS